MDPGSAWVPRIDGRTALVTGAGRGIGAGVAAGLAGAGAAVASLDLDGAAAERTAVRIRQAGGRALACQADVAEATQVEDAVQAVREQLGPVDILVACAAIDEAVPIERLTLEQWQRMVEVNLTGVFMTTQAVLPEMRQRKWGRIILFGSNLAEKGGVDLAHYCAAKAGVHGFARAIARELAPDGVTVNVVAPGPTETDMLRSLPADWRRAKLDELPIGRFADVAEIVPTVLLLASEAGSYYVGSTLNVSGGDVIP